MKTVNQKRFAVFSLHKNENVLSKSVHKYKKVLDKTLPVLRVHSQKVKAMDRSLTGSSPTILAW